MIIAVLFGGQSSEHPVSLMSVTSVINNLDRKYEQYWVGITKDGRWYHYHGPVELIEKDEWNQPQYVNEVIFSPSVNHHGFYDLKENAFRKVDVVFPVLHGRNGEDGTIQGICQMNEIPCISCNLTACAISMDKVYTHVVCEAEGIPMAKFISYTRDNHPDYDEMFKEVTWKLGLPCYVKPSKEGSSFGAHKIKDKEDFDRYVADAFSYDDKILLEEFIDGVEVGCGVLGDGVTGEVFEIVVETEMYGFSEKYDGYKTTINVPATTLSAEQMQQVRDLSKKIYQILGCDGVARVDFFASSKGLIFNETNLMPGFTSHSLYPASFKGIGMSYTELLNRLIDYKVGND